MLSKFVKSLLRLMLFFVKELFFREKVYIFAMFNKVCDVKEHNSTIK